jgi:hypothetical protein
MRRIRSRVEDVLKRIDTTIRNPTMRDEMKEKVIDYNETKDDRKDLSLRDSEVLYRDVDYGDELPLSKKRDVEIDWSSHAEYRSELRDVSPEKVNQTIVERLKDHLRVPEHKKVQFKEPGTGTMVVDFDTKSNPAEARVITVWASLVDRVADFGYNDKMVFSEIRRISSLLEG